MAITKKTAKKVKSGKPFGLNTFAYLVGPQMGIGTREQIKGFRQDYLMRMSVGDADFPATQTRDQWAASYEAWLRLVLIAQEMGRALKPAEPPAPGAEPAAPVEPAILGGPNYPEDH